MIGLGVADSELNFPMRSAVLSLPLVGRVAGVASRVGGVMANKNARALRKRLTPQEVKLWLKLRELKSRGHHFRKQAPLGPYIVDFVSFTDRAVIEVDGGQHNLDSHVHADEVRDQFLLSQGFRVLRFWNSDIDRNLDGVMEMILQTLQTPTRQVAR